MRFVKKECRPVVRELIIGEGTLQQLQETTRRLIDHGEQFEYFPLNQWNVRGREATLDGTFITIYTCKKCDFQILS